MTELTAFLATVYDAFSEAEMQALRHGQARLAELLESGTVPEDVSVPVYHASDVRVNLDVGLVAEETEEGMQVFVTEASAEEASELDFGIELFELLQKEDLEDLDYEEIFPGSDDLPTGTSDEEGDEEREEREERRERRNETDEKREEDREERDGDTIETSDPPIDVIEEIEPRYRARLKDAGITRLSHLIERSPEGIAEALAEEDAEVSPERATNWLSEARGLASLLSERDADLPVELVDGIGPTFGSRLREAGVGDLSDLAERSPEAIAELASTDEVSVSAERATEWLDRAWSHLEAIGAGERPELHSEVDRIDSVEETREPADRDAREAEEGGTDDGSDESTDGGTGTEEEANE